MTQKPDREEPAVRGLISRFFKKYRPRRVSSTKEAMHYTSMADYLRTAILNARAEEQARIVKIVEQLDGWKTTIAGERYIKVADLLTKITEPT